MLRSDSPGPLLSAAVTAACGLLIWLQVRHRAAVDGTTIGLVVIALVPWLMPFVELLKAGPGGIELKRLAEKVEEARQLAEASQASLRNLESQVSRGLGERRPGA